METDNDHQPSHNGCDLDFLREMIEVIPQDEITSLIPEVHEEFFRQNTKSSAEDLILCVSILLNTAHRSTTGQLRRLSRVVSKDECLAMRAALLPVFERHKLRLYNTWSHEVPSFRPIQAHFDRLLRFMQMEMGIDEELKFPALLKKDRPPYPNDILKRIEQPQPPPTEFHRFRALPPELRIMIWHFAVPAQNRVVVTDKLRNIIDAPCPPLFLVCHEAKLFAQDLYKRIRAGTRGADIVKCRAVPIHYQRPGPVVSFEHDIIDIGGWNLWTGGTRRQRDELIQTQYLIQQGEKIKPIHRDILALREKRIRRVALQSIWEGSGLENHYEMLEKMYFRNALSKTERYHARNMDIEVTWLWAWADSVEEVWTIDLTMCEVSEQMCRYSHWKRYRLHPGRVFPPIPGDPCSCSLCNSFDRKGQQVVGYDKPGRLDKEEHERIFLQKPETRHKIWFTWWATQNPRNSITAGVWRAIPGEVKRAAIEDA